MPSLSPLITHTHIITIPSLNNNRGKIMPVSPWEPRWVRPAGVTRGKKCWLLERDVDDPNRWWAAGPSPSGDEVEFGSLNLRLYRDVKSAPEDDAYDELPEPDEETKQAMMDQLQLFKAGLGEDAGDAAAGVQPGDGGGLGVGGGGATTPRPPNRLAASGCLAQRRGGQQQSRGGGGDGFRRSNYGPEGQRRRRWYGRAYHRA